MEETTPAPAANAEAAERKVTAVGGAKQEEEKESTWRCSFFLVL